MVAGHCPSQYLSTDRDAGGYDDRDARDDHHVDADDDVETIWVTYSVYLRLLCEPNVHSTLSMRSVVFVPYRAHRCPAY